MQQSIQQLLAQIARRGSWLGGGSVAALGAALSAALLEKLTLDSRLVRRLQRVRQECLHLVDADAKTFASVIHAVRRGNRAAFRRLLKQATDVPCRIVEYAGAIQAECRRARRAVKPQFQSDLKCAEAMAGAAAHSARALVDTNLAWLKEPGYTHRIHRRLRTASRQHAH